METKKWIVLEDNPMPDTYIPVMLVDDIQAQKLQQKCALFTTSQDAMNHARELQKKFGVKNIRFFYLEGHSENIW